MKKIFILIVVVFVLFGCKDKDKGDELEPKIEMKPSRYGLDYIGGAKYPEVVLANHPEGWASGFLWYVEGFGSAKPLVEDMSESGKSPNQKLHLVWKDDHKFGPAEADLAVQRCKEANPVIRKYQNIQWWVSPWLEPIKYSKDLYFKVINKCREIFKATNVRMVSNAIPTHEYPATYTEMHHKDWSAKPALKLFSFDGLEADESNIDEYKTKAKDAAIIFLWSWRLNGKSNKFDNRKRQDRIHWADKAEIERLVGLVQ